ncbi:MAG: ankyrin repeat domain-containing protein [Gammaproteobacteria bacterium]|nr:ankyrin repeat domain-containing protein [Gammaproteobacteria bacterium]
MPLHTSFSKLLGYFSFLNGGLLNKISPISLATIIPRHDAIAMPAIEFAETKPALFVETLLTTYIPQTPTSSQTAFIKQGEFNVPMAEAPETVSLPLSPSRRLPVREGSVGSSFGQIKLVVMNPKTFNLECEKIIQDMIEIQADVKHINLFHCFAQCNDVEMLTYLHTVYNVNVNAVDPKNGYTALMYAVATNCHSAVKYLAELMEVDVNAKNFLGQTAEDIAREGHKDPLVNLIAKISKWKEETKVIDCARYATAVRHVIASSKSESAQDCTHACK